MSGSGYPKFRNDRGVPEIRIGVNHPHVYINMRTTRTRFPVSIARPDSASILYCLQSGPVSIRCSMFAGERPAAWGRSS